MDHDTENWIDLLFNIGIPLFLLVLTYFTGRVIERRHFQALDREEKALSGIRLTDLGRLPPGTRVRGGTMVQGEVVIACDYYRVFAGSLKNLFGGRIRSFETLLERARREATVRMLHEARRAGANYVGNLRMETCSVGGKQDGNPSGVEAIVYGTAFTLE